MMHFIKTGTVLGGLFGTLTLAAVAQDPKAVTQADSNLAVAKTLLKTDNATTRARTMDEDRRRVSFLARKAKEKAKQETIERLTTSFSTVSESGEIGDICKEAVDEFSAYKSRLYQSQQIVLNERSQTHKKLRTKLKSRCNFIDDVKVASCFVHGLRNASTDFDDISQDILRACVNTHNPAAMQKLWR